MDWNQLFAALAGATLGGLLTILATAAFEQRRDRQEQARRFRLRRAQLDAFAIEVGAVERVATSGSVAEVPSAALLSAYGELSEVGVSPEVVTNYFHAVLRYNGRVRRIIAYEAGNRAAGEDPGVVRVEKQAPPLVEAARTMREVLDKIGK